MATVDQQVYTDGLEVDLLIDGSEWNLLEARVELTQASSPDYVDMIISPTPSTASELQEIGDPTIPESEGGLLGTEFKLDINTELQAPPRDNEITRIFTGKLANLSTAAQGAWEAIAFDPSHQNFQTTENPGGNFVNTKIDITGATDEPNIPLQLQEQSRNYVDYETLSNNSPTLTKISAKVLAEKILEEAPIPEEKKNEPIFEDSPGVEIGERDNGDKIYGGVDRELKFSKQEITVKEALNKLSDHTRSTWWFDRFGEFYIGAPRPGNPVEAWDVRFITDTSAGVTTPPWQSVRVIGSGVASTEGWDKSNINAAQELILEKAIEQGQNVDPALLEPTFIYRNLEIQTQAEAEDVADEIISKLEEQQAQGTVTVVGFPEVRPLDAIVMPNEQPQPMGGSRYSVVKVIHKINPSDGFVTDIHTGGVTDIQEAATEAEAIPVPDRVFQLLPGQR